MNQNRKGKQIKSKNKKQPHTFNHWNCIYKIENSIKKNNKLKQMVNQIKFIKMT